MLPSFEEGKRNPIFVFVPSISLAKNWSNRFGEGQMRLQAGRGQGVRVCLQRSKFIRMPMPSHYT